MRAVAWVGIGAGGAVAATCIALGKIIGGCVDAFINSEEPDVGDEIGDWFSERKPANYLA